MIKYVVALTLALALDSGSMLGSGAASATSHVACKTVASDWTWFSDHLALSISYAIYAEAGRRYAVGTGVFISGKPRGRVAEASGSSLTTAYGAGSLHIRFIDGLGEGRICVEPGALETVPVFKAPL
jgi:hypothetical protein